MSAREIRFIGLIGLATVAVFVVAFAVDPTPPGAGASASDVLNHGSSFSSADRTAAFLFALSGSGLLVLISGLRQWLRDISTAPRWWGTAMLAGGIVTSTMLATTSVLWFTLASHAPLSAEMATFLSDAVNYGFVFAGFGTLVLMGSATAILLTMFGPLVYLGRFGFVATLLQVPYLLTAFFTSGPMQAGSVVSIICFSATGVWVALVSITLLMFARLAAAAAAPAPARS
jgi:hypothetical protein